MDLKKLKVLQRQRNTHTHTHVHTLNPIRVTHKQHESKPHTLSNQTASAVNAGGMELHEFEVLQRQASARHHGVAVASAGVRRRGREVRAAVALQERKRYII